MPAATVSSVPAPIVCRSLTRRDAVPSESGNGIVGYAETKLARRLTITLKKGRVEKTVNTQNQVIETTVEGWNAEFVDGTLEISSDQIQRSGMTRDEIVAILRSSSPGRFDVLA